ncbi:hypothetical protein K503DRAFT_740842 [Rhizopogon vinicolor AM-OR11-026]|uniref:RING-type domain-containing protein n=1 Tax=Rhizopogon vinicolor AM-OR11-026 TaxID=1314800 RepID=A0A1B7N1A7_9AGAM|nr:hypothetical protein K503DRAFT_740842 [Rhizopogon vinicolor AM-OR11-026]
MSNTASAQAGQETEFEFWDFVNCSLCHLSFTSSDRGPPPIPFWITECGHVLCNNHLKPDQSCAQCSAQNIQLVPLHRDIEPPMSDWFRALPYSLDSIANAVKFQQETLAGLVRYYHQAYSQLIQTCERIRADRRALRKEVDSLRREVQHLRQCASGFDLAQEPSSFPNASGKRPMTDTRDVKASSSPRSIVTPIGPNRITLPFGEQPNLTRQDNGQMSSQMHQMGRPGTSHFVEQYAYHSEQGSRMQAAQLSHEQSLPTRHLRLSSGEQGHRSMPPPPPPVPGPGGRFRPATGSTDTRTTKMPNTQMIAPQTAQQQPPALVSRTQQRQFAVPQTPHRTSATLFTGQASGGHQTPSHQSSRFMPPSHGRSKSGTGAVTSSNVPGSSSGGHRMSFVSGGTNGFG